MPSAVARTPSKAFPSCSIFAEGSGRVVGTSFGRNRIWLTPCYTEGSGVPPPRRDPRDGTIPVASNCDREGIPRKGNAPMISKTSFMPLAVAGFLASSIGVAAAGDLDSQMTGSITPSGVQSNVAPPPPDPHELRGDFRDTRPPDPHELRGDFRDSRAPDPHELRGDFRDTRPPAPDPHELRGDFRDTRPPAPDPHELRGDFRDTRPPAPEPYKIGG